MPVPVKYMRTVTRPHPYLLLLQDKYFEAYYFNLYMGHVYFSFQQPLVAIKFQKIYCSPAAYRRPISSLVPLHRYRPKNVCSFIHHLQKYRIVLRRIMSVLLSKMLLHCTNFPRFLPSSVLHEINFFT